MPGKVNPTQCEALAMVACQVMGNNTAITIAGSSGHLQLNTYKPLMIHNLIWSITLLTESITSFNLHCAVGLEPNEEVIRHHLEQSLMLVTALNPAIGYDKAAAIAKKAHAEGLTLKESAVALGLLTAEEFERLVQPKKMVHP